MLLWQVPSTEALFQMTGLKGSATNILVPDTTASGVHELTGQGYFRWQYNMMQYETHLINMDMSIVQNLHPVGLILRTGLWEFYVIWCHSLRDISCLKKFVWIVQIQFQIVSPDKCMNLLNDSRHTRRQEQRSAGNRYYEFSGLIKLYRHNGPCVVGKVEVRKGCGLA